MNSWKYSLYFFKIKLHFVSFLSCSLLILTNYCFKSIELPTLITHHVFFCCDHNKILVCFLFIVMCVLFGICILPFFRNFSTFFFHFMCLTKHSSPYVSLFYWMAWICLNCFKISIYIYPLNFVCLAFHHGCIGNWEKFSFL